MDLSYIMYNLVMHIGKTCFSIVNHATVLCPFRKGKLKKFVEGQERLLQAIHEKMEDCSKKKVWLHVASLGEYAVARPIIRQMHSDNNVIILTIFSPSAYEVLCESTKKDDEADYVFYLPWDTQENARQFLDINHPSKAIFIISEYWINYLRELERRHIPTYFVSSLIPNSSYLFKWYARPIRKAIPKYTEFMVLDEVSKKNLNKMGFNNVTVTGDPLFDNALNMAQIPFSNDIIERFCSTAKGGVLIAGSISDIKDLKIVSSYANSHRNIKCIFVPHEISEEKLNEIKYHLDGWAELYSDCTPETDFSKRQVLIIDFIGALSRIYRYGKWAYVGGGFTPYLHSVIEPIVYGLPVAFGPCIHRKVTPKQMIDLGIGKMVKSAKEFSSWMDYLASDEHEMMRIRQVATDYANRNSGATMRVVQTINEEH